MGRREPHHGPYRLISQSVLARFGDASADLLARRSLLRRTDSKFLLRPQELADLLIGLGGDYGILRAGGEPIADYRTLYYDTPGLRCFHDHRRGRRARHKVRVRHYTDRHVTFLEVKTKRSDEITYKKRRAKPYGESALDADDIAFIGKHSSVPGDALVEQVWTDFRRLTLIGLHTNERVTVDMDLQLRDGELVSELAGVCILEVKQSPFCLRTPIMHALRQSGQRPLSMSKYCTAAALNRGSLRLNRLLPSLRAIERIAK